MIAAGVVLVAAGFIAGRSTAETEQVRQSTTTVREQATHPTVSEPTTTFFSTEEVVETGSR